MASIRKRPDGRWRARYRDESGKEHARHFRRKVDAQQWLDAQTAKLVTGTHVDPKAGKVTFRDYAEGWRKVQPHKPATAKRVRLTLENHLYPTLGSTAMSSIRPTRIQALVKSLSGELAASSVRAVVQTLRAVFRAAVHDRIIPVSPCDRVALPSTPARQLTIPDRATLEAIAAALPGRYRAAVYVGAGLGLRPGEIWGLTVEDVDFLRSLVHVRRQLDERGQLVALKTAASYRTVPLPESVKTRLAAHLAASGRRDGLVFVGEKGGPVNRGVFHAAWTAARKAVGVPTLKLHDLRHAYASALIASGESVKTVQTRLGHGSAALTLDTYSHLWPDSDDKTRAAVDAFLSAGADSMRTGAAT